MPRPICILDANVIIADRRFRGAAAVAFLRSVARGDIDAAIPWVALEEAIANFREQVIIQAQVTRKAAKELSRLGIRSEQHLDPDQEASGYREWLTELLRTHGIEIMPIPSAQHEVLVRWAIDGRKPFNADGTGYRDAVIWHSVVEASQSQSVFFVTADADFAASRKAGDQLDPSLIDDLNSMGGGEGSTRVARSLAVLLEALAEEAPDVVEALNRAFETDRPVRARLVEALETALLDAQTDDIEVQGIRGPVIEILPEVVHDPLTLIVEQATVTDDETYYLQIYVEADVDLYVSWMRDESDFSFSFSMSDTTYESKGTTATLSCTVEATYYRREGDFRDVRVSSSAHGSALVDP